MPSTTDDQEVQTIAETASPELVRRLNFLTGSLDLKNVTVTVAIDGERFQLIFDEHGSLSDIEPLPQGPQ